MRPGRIECSQCLRPKGHCLCHALASVCANFNTLIWQHPDESSQRFKSAHFAPIQLSRCQLIQSETLSPDSLNQERTALIYLSDRSQEWSTAPHQQFETLLFLDGTWNKTNKLLHLNPWTKVLPQYHLSPQNLLSKLAPLRRAKSENQLCTLEAVALAHELATGDQKYSQITKVLDVWVNDQRKYQN